MYCVRCGVKLQEGEKSCPLCHTPLWQPEITPEKKSYSDLYPKESHSGKYLLLGFITLMLGAVALVCLIICLQTYGRVNWSGYVMLGLALGWILFILPFSPKKISPFVLVPLDFAAVCGYLLYICLRTRGHWFLSFAFPVTGLIAILTMAGVVLFSTIRRGRLIIAGSLFIVLGGFCMLAELFASITFHTPMFLWSLYCVSVFSAIGIFLLLAGIIPSLHSYLERRLFF